MENFLRLDHARQGSFFRKPNALCLPSARRQSWGQTDAITAGKEKTRPAEQVHAQFGEQDLMSYDPTDRFKHAKGSTQEIRRRPEIARSGRQRAHSSEHRKESICDNVFRLHSSPFRFP